VTISDLNRIGINFVLPSIKGKKLTPSETQALLRLTRDGLEPLTSFFILRSNRGSIWNDNVRQGGVYTFGSEVPNYTKLAPGSRVLFDRKVDGGVEFFAMANIGEVKENDNANGKTFVASLIDFDAFSSPVIVSPDMKELLRKEANYNQQHSIRPIAKETYEGILELIRPQEQSVTPEAGPTLQDLSSITFLEEHYLQELEDLITDKKQLIFFGPPGTGKTFVAKQLARYLTRGGGQFDVVQFHPSYSYEDFVEGIRPQPHGSTIEYPIVDGVLKRISQSADLDPDHTYILIIDEINRGNLSRILGELIYSLEYRQEPVRLPYSQKNFSLPQNLYIIGTMNSADRSIALPDYALRRRFLFIEFLPEEKILSKWFDANPPAIEKEKILALFLEMNNRIGTSKSLGKHFQIGHSYFMQKDMGKVKLEKVWKYSIRPLIGEYFFEEPDELEAFDKLFKEKLD
jgi:MoxR-like ATPase